MKPLRRRTFLASSLTAVGVAASSTLADAAEERPASKKQRFEICAFIKFLQTLSYDRLVESMAKLGFDGIELGVYDVADQLSESKVTEYVRLTDVHGLAVGTVLYSMPPARWPEICSTWFRYRWAPPPPTPPNAPSTLAPAARSSTE